MKTIIRTTGCTAYDWTVDGKSLRDFSKEELDSLQDYVILALKQEIANGTILLTNLFELFQYSNYSYDSEPCDQCGDHVASTTYEI